MLVQRSIVILSNVPTRLQILLKTKVTVVAGRKEIPSETKVSKIELPAQKMSVRRRTTSHVFKTNCGDFFRREYDSFNIGIGFLMCVKNITGYRKRRASLIPINKIKANGIAMPKESMIARFSWREKNKKYKTSPIRATRAMTIRLNTYTSMRKKTIDQKNPPFSFQTELKETFLPESICLIITNLKIITPTPKIKEKKKKVNPDTISSFKFSLK